MCHTGYPIEWLSMVSALGDIEQVYIYIIISYTVYIDQKYYLCVYRMILALLYTVVIGEVT